VGASRSFDASEPFVLFGTNGSTAVLCLGACLEIILGCFWRISIWWYSVGFPLIAFRPCYVLIKAYYCYGFAPALRVYALFHLLEDGSRLATWKLARSIVWPRLLVRAGSYFRLICGQVTLSSR
jgi:hypothetical protein